MIRFIIVLAVIVVILFILRSRGNTKITQNKYRTAIIAVIILGFFFLIATSGRYLFPQILQLIKLGLPFLTKFIGI